MALESSGIGAGHEFVQIVDAIAIRVGVRLGLGRTKVALLPRVRQAIAIRVGGRFHGERVAIGKVAGGIAGAYEALQAARKAGLKTMIGCMIESSVLITAAAHLAELADHLDLDGNLLVTNDPYLGATAERGIISFAQAPDKTGLGVRAGFRC